MPGAITAFASERRFAARPARGFTLVEILAVMAIIGALSVLAVPAIGDAVDRARIARAIGDMRAIQSDLDGQETLPPDLAAVGRSGLLDPWGNAYQYLRFPSDFRGPPQGARRDRFLVPINSSYDLYSMGKDGASEAPLPAAKSRDDIVRANDGGYIGLASKF